MFRLFQTFFLIFLFTISNIGNSRSATTITKEQLVEDGKQTIRLLKKYHPNLYAHRSKKTLEKLWREYESEIRSRPNEYDQITYIQQILASVCDEHTHIVLRLELMFKNIQNRTSLPRSIMVLNDKLHWANSSHTDKNKKIRTINNVSDSAIIAFLRSVTSADGCAKSELLMPALHNSNHLQMRLLSNRLRISNSVKVDEEIISSGKVSSKSILANSNYSLVANNNSKRPRIKGLANLDLDLSGFRDTNDSSIVYLLGMKPHENLVDIFYTPDRSFTYVKVNDFWGDKEKIAQMDRELRKLVRTKPKQVLIDLMSNAGGSSVIAQRFMSYFLTTASKFAATGHVRSTNLISEKNFTLGKSISKSELKKHLKQFRRGKKLKHGIRQLPFASRSFGNKSYNGELIVLVSPQTRSAATIVASILKRNSNATIVGDIGNASMVTACTQAIGQFKLPNSEIDIMIPTTCFKRHRLARTKGNLLEPDIKVDLSNAFARAVYETILNAAVENTSLSNYRSQAIERQLAQEQEKVEIRKALPTYSRIVKAKRQCELRGEDSFSHYVRCEVRGTIFAKPDYKTSTKCEGFCNRNEACVAWELANEVCSHFSDITAIVGGKGIIGTRYDAVREE